MNNFYKYSPHLPPNSINNFRNIYNNRRTNFNTNCLTRNESSCKSKFDFCSIKENTCQSLNDVEHVLCNFSSFVK